MQGEETAGDAAPRRDYNEFAFRELRRARKAFTPDEHMSEAQFAVQMAHVAALLDVADAIRARNP